MPAGYTKEMRAANALKKLNQLSQPEIGGTALEESPPRADIQPITLPGGFPDGFMPEGCKAAPVNPPKVFGLSDKEATEFLKDRYEQNERMAGAAIAQAELDAATIATARVRNHPITQALLANLGSVENREKFLEHFGPTKQIPDRPAPNAMGDKDPAYMKWMADYYPEQFLEKYKASTSPLTKELRNLIKGRK